MPEMKITRRWAVALAVAAMATLGACGGDGGSGSDAVDEALEGGGTLEVDNCTLLTNEEVSSLAGFALESSGDSPMGCAYPQPGEVMGEFSIRSYRGSGDATAAAAELAPSLQVIPLSGVGDDAVALSDSDGSVNFLIARKGDLFVELVMTFLDVTPESPSLDQAGQLASTALGRLVEAA